ncbi:MAG TPA: flagellar export protein FliJ [Steroidobacteraceae bacterium]|jgi:flagellar FliJ protein
MNRAKRLEPVQEVVGDAERRLAQSVAAFERRVREAETKLQELERYRLEYEQQYSQRVGLGISASGLRDYQAFLSRLSEAIKQQQVLVQRAGAERDAEQQRWQQAAKRAKALNHVVGQWQADERRASDRREQLDTDERGQRKASREL